MGDHDDQIAAARTSSSGGETSSPITATVSYTSQQTRNRHDGSGRHHDSHSYDAAGNHYMSGRDMAHSK